MGTVEQQFFPIRDRPEALVEVRLPEGSSIAATGGAVGQVEAWLREQPEASVIASYIGQGAPRFFHAMAPELPDPAFAKIVILTRADHQRACRPHRDAAAAHPLSSFRVEGRTERSVLARAGGVGVGDF